METASRREAEKRQEEGGSGAHVLLIHPVDCVEKAGGRRASPPMWKEKNIQKRRKEGEAQSGGNSMVGCYLSNKGMREGKKERKEGRKAGGGREYLHLEEEEKGRKTKPPLSPCVMRQRK